MRLSPIDKELIQSTVLHQLKNYWVDVNEKIVIDSIPAALDIIEKCFRDLPNKRYYDGTNIVFSPYISVHWMIFLYRLSHEIYIKNVPKIPKEADQVYYLNKALHSNDWLYAIDLPIHFLCEHPLGSVLGRAKYGDYLFVYQGTTVGGNKKGNEIFYPILGNNVTCYANSTVLGDTHIGNNVIISADTYIINEVIPDNCIVFGKSPNIVIKKKSEQEIKSYTAHIWNWR